MAVNLSPLQFAQDNLLEAVLGILQRTGLAPSRLELEVTEGALMQDFEAAIKVLGALKQYGVTIAIDDFGTGYSSLSYLKRFPLDRLKIDRSFITEIGQSSETGAITQSIIAMAHRLNLQVIAEGVENECQVAFLQLHACDEIQGFLYGRPLPPSEFEQQVLRLDRLREA
jgi:EAL domain-containing protein (putative c-di-GMP-specific phosphodiesterase class I)